MLNALTRSKSSRRYYPTWHASFFSGRFVLPLLEAFLSDFEGGSSATLPIKMKIKAARVPPIKAGGALKAAVNSGKK
ncbi:MAG: hypothetical protein ABIT23_09830, partial [Nitrosospira sp.]